MANRADITPELCRQLLRYEPDTGKLFWRERPADMFPQSEGADFWNSTYAGKEALTARHAEGYCVGKILTVLVRAHRVAWAIYYGVMPKDQIDHVDGDKSNNRIDNLRLVDNRENQRNVRLTKNNSSGVCGVHWSVRAKRWIARIGLDGRQVHLGSFSTLESAAAARYDAEKGCGFHPLHGTR